MKLSAPLVVLLFGSIMFQSCAYVLPTYEYSHVTPEIPDREFFYTAYNVTGSATATYIQDGLTTSIAPGIMNGVIADAKRNLIQEHPLGQNELYVNWSIDKVVTTAGIRFFKLHFLRRMDYQVVASADVIKFGVMPDDFMPRNYPNSESRAAGMGSNNRTQIQQPLEGQNTSGESQLSTSATRPISVGDAVLFLFEGSTIQGLVVAKSQNAEFGDFYRVEFEVNGKKRHKNLYAKDVVLSQK